MPRIARGLSDGFVYHVINRGNNKQQVFHKDQDYDAFMDLVASATKRFSVKLYAYCLMPNHFHFVVSPEQGTALSAWMHLIMTSHVRRYNKYYEVSGHVWQGRFKSFPVQRDEHLLVLMRYVEGNPVRSGLTATARDWLWSSHRERIGESPTRFLAEVPIALPEFWTRYVDAKWTESEIERVRECVNRQAPFGSSTWRDQVGREFGLESTMRPRGRPRKLQD